MEENEKEVTLIEGKVSYSLTAITGNQPTRKVRKDWFVLMASRSKKRKSESKVYKKKTSN